MTHSQGLTALKITDNPYVAASEGGKNGYALFENSWSHFKVKQRSRENFQSIQHMLNMNSKKI